MFIKRKLNWILIPLFIFVFVLLNKQTDNNEYIIESNVHIPIDNKRNNIKLIEDKDISSTLTEAHSSNGLIDIKKHIVITSIGEDKSVDDIDDKSSDTVINIGEFIDVDKYESFVSNDDEVINIGEFIDVDKYESFVSNDDEVINIGEFIDIDVYLSSLPDVVTGQANDDEVINIGEFIDIDVYFSSLPDVVTGQANNEEVINVGEFIDIDALSNSKDPE